jgi:hypothetical protein
MQAHSETAKVTAEAPGKATKAKEKGLSAPSTAQRAWLTRGLNQAGGKLPLFDSQGQQVCERTVHSCIEKGWAEPWFSNPLKPDWIVCKLTDAGRAALT